MENLTKEELEFLEEIINEEIKSCLDNGWGLNSEFVTRPRNILKKLGLKETYPFNKWYTEEGDK